MDLSSSKTVAFGARQVAVIVTLVFFWVLAVGARLLWNGDVYGLGYRLFHPDGVCYGAMASDSLQVRGSMRERNLLRRFRAKGHPSVSLGRTWMIRQHALPESGRGFCIRS